MIGVECVSLPSFADHLMFLPVAGSKESGKPRSLETILRVQAWPHWGWSEAKTAKLQHPSTNKQRSPNSEMPNNADNRRRVVPEQERGIGIAEDVLGLIPFLSLHFEHIEK